MEDLKKKNTVDAGDKEIVFSKSVKAGKRIYYLDVKKNRKDDLFIAITESKKVVSGEGDNSQVSFEKHKIFLYKEDFEKFVSGLVETIDFINIRQSNGVEQGKTFDEKEDSGEKETSFQGLKEGQIGEEIKIEIDF